VEIYHIDLYKISPFIHQAKNITFIWLNLNKTFLWMFINKNEIPDT
jgi:hypothetical protein